MALLALLPTEPTTVNLPASESVWVYSHAGSPGTDEFLRIWGIDGAAVPDKPGENDDYSFGYLSFDLSNLPSGKITEAVLVVQSIDPPTFAPAAAKQTPLQARPLVGSFDPATWSFEMSRAVAPASGKELFGSGSIAPSTPHEIDIELLLGSAKFSDKISKALADPKHRLYVALTSGISPSEGGSGAGGVYKIYSAKAQDHKLAPTLRLKFE